MTLLTQDKDCFCLVPSAIHFRMWNLDVITCRIALESKNTLECLNYNISIFHERNAKCQRFPSKTC